MANVQHLEALRKGAKFWNAWRKEHQDVTPDLAGAELHTSDLRRMDLSQADLAGADMRGSVLSGAVLSSSNLEGAKLQGSILCDTTTRIALVDFYGVPQEDRSKEMFEAADATEVLTSGVPGFNFGPEVQGFQKTLLLNANLQRADLSRAVLVGASLAGTRLSGATFSETCIDSNLCEVYGLDETTHRRASRISNAALASLEHPLPEKFLRGIGLQDWQIEAAKLHRRELSSRQMNDIVHRIFDIRCAQPVQYYSVFISYSHTDKLFAGKLYESLQRKGIRCWYDEHQLLPGDDIYEGVDRGIAGWDKVLLCCSRASLTSWWVDNEIISVFEKEQLLYKKRGEKVLALVPLNLDNFVLSNDWSRGYKRQLNSRLAADFIGWDSDNARFEEQVEDVIRALRIGKDSREPPPASML
jgi:uncharacterized protein YjbI with pentapeptide repeats